jgi:hypothetical protein
MDSARIAHHILKDGSSHLDLFILPEKERSFSEQTHPLVTYEIGIHYLSYFKNLPAQSCFIIRPGKSCSPLTAGKTGFCGFRKNNHRMVYMDYEGNLSDDRGFLIDIGQFSVFPISETSYSSSAGFRRIR